MRTVGSDQNMETKRPSARDETRSFPNNIKWIVPTLWASLTLTEIRLFIALIHLHPEYLEVADVGGEFRQTTASTATNTDKEHIASWLTDDSKDLAGWV